jgi:predicted RNA-binding Zn-ribbon protein involved in translation (DUF1610 family)
MMRFLAVLSVLVILVAGCSSKSSTTTQDTAAQGPATASGPPKVITLTNQTQVWACPTCGMTYDGPGECEMKDGTLVLMNVRYVCPTGGEGLPGVGRCPVHGVEARVDKTPAAAPDSTG